MLGCPGLPRGMDLADASGPGFKWEPPSSAEAESAPRAGASWGLLQQ